MIFSPLNMIALHGSYASCIMATFNHNVCVVVVVLVTFNADVTACHKWPTKTTIFFSQKTPRTQNNHYIRSSKLIYAILSLILILQMCKLHRYIFPIYVYFHFTAPTVDCTVFVRVSLLSMTEPVFIMTINAFVIPNSRDVDCVVVISLPGRQCVVWLHRIMGRDQRRRIYFPVYGRFECGMSYEGSV